MGGNEVEVTFDLANHLVTQVVVQTEDGPLTITCQDWRRVGKVSFPFRKVETSSTGETTTFEVKRVRVLSKLPPDALARPARSPHGLLLSAEGARIPFRYLGSHILVSALVNGVPADVVFDTGAANYFSPVWAKQFGLKVSGGLNVSGVGESSTKGGYALAKKMSLGSAVLSDEVVLVGPVPWDARPGQPGPAGSVGFEFLAEFRTTIDYPAQTMSFAEFGQAPVPSDAGTRVPFYSDGHSPYIEAEVDGHRGLFRLDTGDGGTVTLFPAFAKRHNLYQGTGEDVVSGAGVGGKVRAHKITLSNFKLAGTDFCELPANLSQNQAGSFASRTLAGSLGGGILRCYRITFDYPARFLTFQAVPEHLRDCVKVH
jgi:predicted aspartyl protease